MRTVAEYFGKAIEFEALSEATDDASLKKRYADIAQCYRLFARESEWLVGRSAIGDAQMDRPRSA